jgi:chorismate synthase
MMNSVGTIFRVTTFGESHGPALGCVVDGCPAGVAMDESALLRQLARRRPGQSAITSARDEGDVPEILSGIFEGVSLGTPIAMLVRNRDARSGDYDRIKREPRPGHADETWRAKFGHADHRGGGRSSGRETVSRVMAGWVAEMLLQRLMPQLGIVAFVSRVGAVTLGEEDIKRPWSRDQVDAHDSRCPDAEKAGAIEAMLADAKKEGESYGGTISLRVSGLPAGIGEPVFLKLHSYLAATLSTIGTMNAVNWNERSLDLPGSEFHAPGNSYGGINGGISNGQDLLFHISGKPVSTLGDTAKAGRHDPCILPRAVPVVESMAAIVLADLVMLNRLRRVD